jgi:hypothetical protein
LVLVLAACAFGCGDVTDLDRLGVEEIASPIIGPEQWVAQSATVNFSESNNFAVKAGSTWEMINVYNNDAFLFRYSCSRDGGITWQERSTTAPAGNDPTGVFKARAVTGPKAFVLRLFNDTQGIRLKWWRIAEPCPASGGTSWTAFTPTYSGIDGFDYPKAFYQFNTDLVWHSFHARNTATGRTSVYLSKLFNDGTVQTTEFACDNHTNINANAVAEGKPGITGGKIHVVYLDATMAQVRSVVFDTNSRTFDCGSVRVIGPKVWQAAGNCPADPTCPTLPNVGGGSCLRDTTTLAIAVVNAIPMKVVVAYHTAGTGACSQQAETRFYRRDMSAPNWTLQAVTSCYTAVQPAMATAYTHGFGGNDERIHVMSKFATGNQLLQADYLSTDTGLTWNGVALTAGRSVSATNGCYWEDYHGATADMSRNRMFYNWGQLNTASGTWDIRGVTNDP